MNTDKIEEYKLLIEDYHLLLSQVVELETAAKKLANIKDDVHSGVDKVIAESVSITQSIENLESNSAQLCGIAESNEKKFGDYMQTISDELDTLNRKSEMYLADNTEKLLGELSGNISFMSGALDDQLKNIQKEIDQRINSMQNKLDNRIDGMAAVIDERLKTINNLCDEVSEKSSQLSAVYDNIIKEQRLLDKNIIAERKLHHEAKKWNTSFILNKIWIPILIAAIGVSLGLGLVLGSIISRIGSNPAAPENTDTNHETTLNNIGSSSEISDDSSINPDETQARINATVEIGDSLFFGSYEQDNDLSNGKEDIEWIVLEKENDNVLVISKYALDCKPFNSFIADITWDKCSLREWLNVVFLNNAFSVKEQDLIATSNVRADYNPEYSTDPGNATNDKVFLLSITEVEEYYPYDIERWCAPTKYAVANGAINYGENGTCSWWLRTPGSNPQSASVITREGSIAISANFAYHIVFAVRPALWLSLKS